jgi:DNA-binding response OmpR family regulator
MKNGVLIVDDDPSILGTVQKILVMAGFEVCTASSGEECLEVLQKGFQGLVLMDILMPKMDGWDTIKEIVERGLNEKIIICMLTGVGIPSKKMEGLKEYVMDYITKPFDQKKLVAVVKEYLSYIK